MLRRHSNRTSTHNNVNGSSTTSSLQQVLTRSSSVKKRPTTNSRDSIFKVIVVIEVIFLVIIWSFYSERLYFASMWRRQKTVSISRSATTNDYNDDYNDDKGQDDENDDTNKNEKEHVPLWAHQLRDESREKHKREQEKRRELARIGTIHEIPEQFKGPTLIIGGSDGSGTRAFARYMLKLGVPMRIDDKESLDVHGAVMFEGQGWPPLAKSILNGTHSANYELSNLPSDTRLTAVHELQRLKYALDAWQLKLEQRFFIRQHLNKTTPRASNAAVGFKAPITMLLLPLIKEVFGKVKYLHIVRDGRDVALSTNTSPVQKFYQTMYTDANQRMNTYSNDSYPVLAMHLWNDWNTQALEWEQAHSTDSDFDSLVMRSEDLVNPARKFEALARLAAFVGSPKTLKEICCLSQEREVDMGQSLVSNEVAAGDYNKDKRSLWGKIRVPFPGSLRHRRYESNEQNKVEGIRKRFALHRYHDFFHGGFESGHLEESEPKSKDEEKENLDERSREQDNHRRLLETTGATRVFSRYGKWREMLKDNPRLSALLHQAGAKGLSKFGYEPESSFMDPRTSPVKGFVCDETVACKE